MARPKKDIPHHSSGMYEYKTIVGNNIDGTPIRKSFYSAKSKADAKQKAIEYKIKQGIADATGELFVEKNATFESYAKKFLASVLGTVKDSTYSASYKNTIENHLIPYFKKTYLKNISQIDIQAYINIKNKKYSPETIYKHKNCLHSIFESALLNNLCAKNPVTNLKLPPKKPVIEKLTYTQEQANLIAEYAKTHRFGLEILLLLEYGLSRSELLGLKWTDIDADNLTLSVNRGVTDVKNAITGKIEVIVGEPKNEFRKRVIPISKEISDLINSTPHYKIIGENKHKKITGKKIDTEFIVSNKFGKVCSPASWDERHYHKFMSEMQAYYKALDIDIPILHPHELRHTRASLWVNSGANLFAVANVLGHSDLSMLKKRYAHKDVESTRKLLNIK